MILILLPASFQQNSLSLSNIIFVVCFIEKGIKKKIGFKNKLIYCIPLSSKPIHYLNQNITKANGVKFPTHSTKSLRKNISALHINVGKNGSITSAHLLSMANGRKSRTCCYLNWLIGTVLNGQASRDRWTEAGQNTWLKIDTTPFTVDTQPDIIWKALFLQKFKLSL